VRTQPTSAHRRLAIQGFDLASGGHHFFALLEFDVTGLRSRLRVARQEGRGGSLFAFFLKAVAVTVAEQPVFNSLGTYRRTTTFDTVDIAVPIEVVGPEGVENRQHVLRSAHLKSVADLDAEMTRAKAEGTTGFVGTAWTQRLLGRLPRSVVRGLFRLVLAHPKWVQAFSGTLFVTSVSMFSSVPGFVVPFVGGPKAVSFAFGSAVRKPVAVGDRVEIREIVSVTAAFNHDLVDGAPAARFINRLRHWLEVDPAGLL